MLKEEPVQTTSSVNNFTAKSLGLLNSGTDNHHGYPDPILNNLAENVIIFDSGLSILWSNKLAESELNGSICYQKLCCQLEPCVDCAVVITRRTGRPHIMEQKTINRNPILIRAFPILDNTGNVTYIIEIATDISEQKVTEAQLHAERENFRNSFQNLPFGVQIINPSGKLVYINQTMLGMWGFETIEQLMAKRLEQIFTPESALLVSELYKQRTVQQVPPVHEITMICSDNQLRHVRVNAREMTWNGENCIQLIYEDITENKQIKKGLRRLSDTLELVRAIDRLIAREENEKELLQKGCDEIAKGQRYPLAWIGFLRKDTGDLTPIAVSGESKAYLDNIRITLDDSLDYQGPVNIALKSGKPCVISHIETDPRFKLWKDKAIELGLKSVIALPIKIQGKIIGILNIYSSQPDAFSQPKVELLEELTVDLSVGIEKIRHREENLKAQQALADEAVRRSVFIERSTDGIVILDRNGGVFDANRRFSEMLGYTPEEVRKLHIWDWDTKFSHDELMNMADSIIDAGPRVETKHRRKDGSVYDVEISSNAAVFAGRKLIFCVCRDITERTMAQEALRISEEWNRTLVSICPDGIISVNINGIITFASQKIFELFGTPVNDEVIGQSVLKWIAPEARETMASNISNVLVGKAVSIHEYPVINKEGVLFWIEANSSIIKDANGIPVGLIAVVRDITERKKIQDNLILTDRLASIGELSSGMAHELNNPLTAVIGFADLILEQEVPDSIREDLDLLSREAKRMAEVTKNMLTFARKHPVAKTRLNLNNIIEKVLEIRAYEHRLNNIQIINRMAVDLPDITGDYFQLQQVILNIIINAEYFMKESHDSGILNICTEKTSSGIRVTIADNGPGIARENLDRIFNPFFTTKPIGKGTGLGLSICYGVITEHNGQIHAESEMGKGTAFIIELPVSL